MNPPNLPLGRYRAIWGSPAPIRLGPFPGSPWRGALGHALRRTVCVTRQADCPSCLLYRSCLFPYFFDTPPDGGTSPSSPISG